MIEIEAVVATKNGFVVADKIKGRQLVRDGSSETFLDRISFQTKPGLLVETKHFAIVVDVEQEFIVDLQTSKRAEDLEKNENILTSEGFEKITNLTPLSGTYPMAAISTESGTLVANSFVLRAYSNNGEN